MVVPVVVVVVEVLAVVGVVVVVVPVLGTVGVVGVVTTGVVEVDPAVKLTVWFKLLYPLVASHVPTLAQRIEYNGFEISGSGKFRYN